MQSVSIRVGTREIGRGLPTYVVAEMSGNHNQSYERALDLVRAAKAAGADAVKVQTYTADTMTIRSDSELFRINGGGPWDGRMLYDLYEEASMPWEWQPRLLTEARHMGMELFSTPFDESAVAFLDSIGVSAFKVASFEIVDLPLIQRIARAGKPIFISTGMATEHEIREALECARAAGANDVVLLKCTSAYPADPSDMNLSTIPHMWDVFKTPIGLSDHSLDVAVPAAAVALGACVVEKHLTMRRADGGPDAGFSLEPEELAAMIGAIRTIERALGTVRFGPSELERGNQLFRRSLFVTQDVQAGATFTTSNVRAIRPGHGLPPKHLVNILGRHAARDIDRGTPLSWEMIKEQD